jgi:hypothetical protein
MSHIPTMQSLAFFADTHLGEHRSPGEQSTPSTFEVVVEAYAHSGCRAGRTQVEARACEQVMALLPDGEEPPADLKAEVATFVDQSLQFLQAQYPEAADVRLEQPLLAILFSAHLEQAHVAAASW